MYTKALFKQAGHSQVGPPHFMKPQPWMTKYNQVKNTMTMIGEKLNDPALKPGGQLHVRLQDIKKDHETKLKVLSFLRYHCENNPLNPSANSCDKLSFCFLIILKNFLFL